MLSINAYLNFNGNCREAMNFYKECLGGKLNLQTIGESPLSEKMPAKMKQHILHATLTNEKLVLMGSDMVSEKGVQKGNAVSMILNCSTEEEISEKYEKLANGGEATHTLEHTFFGALFGDLSDRYGNNWLLHYEKQKQEMIHDYQQ